MPELDCSFLTTQKDNCIDKIKLQKLPTIIIENEQAQQDYYIEFGHSTITVQEIYPKTETTTIYENKIEYTSKLTTQSPILLYDPFTQEYAFGIIEVAMYVE